jgi:hypothetical protein
VILTRGEVSSRRRPVRGPERLCEQESPDAIRDSTRSGRESDETHHLDVLFLVLWDIFNVDVLGFRLRERLVRGRDGGKKGLYAR